MTTKLDTMKEALNLLTKIDTILDLGKKGLARVSETREIEKEAKLFLQNNLDSDSELGREYEKWIKATHYYDIPRDGFAVRSHLAPLESLRRFLTRLLDASDIKTLPSQQYIKTGEVYSGRKVLRDILNQARTKIDIQDNYLDSEVLAILHPYFETNANLEGRLLTSDKVNLSFKSDLALFSKQYGKIAVKIHDQAHGRFIVLDDSEVYSIGHSLKDVGKKADVISKIDEPDAKKEVVEDFSSWWTSGNDI